jgi:hypothetical protein
MRKLAIFVCAVALLLAFTNVATATKPTGGTFVMQVTFLQEYVPTPLPSGLTKFSMTAGGIVYPIGESGYFAGNFSYDEKGIVNLNTGHGTNQGVMTITAIEGSTVTIRFQGQTYDFQMSDPVPVGTVSGNFVVLDGTGVYEHLHGQGTYVSSVPGNLFAVTFTGRFH